VAVAFPPATTCARESRRSRKLHPCQGGSCFRSSEAKGMGVTLWRRGGDKGRDKGTEAGPSEELAQLCLLVLEFVCSVLKLSLLIWILGFG
jgi:hypothetical protein